MALGVSLKLLRGFDKKPFGKRLNKFGNFYGKINDAKTLILLMLASHSCAGSP
jgi:hypothetical protein